MSNHFPANSLKKVIILFLIIKVFFFFILIFVSLKVSSISSGMYTNYCQQYTSPSFDEDNETSVSSFDDAVSKYSNQSFNKRYLFVCEINFVFVLIELNSFFFVQSDKYKCYFLHLISSVIIIKRICTCSAKIIQHNAAKSS